MIFYKVFSFIKKFLIFVKLIQRKMKKIVYFWNKINFDRRLKKAKKQADLKKQQTGLTFMVLEMFGRPVVANKNIIIQKLNDNRKKYKFDKIDIKQVEKNALYVAR